MNITEHANTFSIEVLVTSILLVSEIVSKEVVVDHPDSKNSRVESKSIRSLSHQLGSVSKAQCRSDKRHSSEYNDGSGDGTTEASFSMNFTELIGIRV